MEEVADSVGFSKPMIYQYFNGKEQLLEHVTVRLMNDFYSSLAREAERGGVEAVLDSIAEVPDAAIS